MKTRQNWSDLSHHLPDPISFQRPQDVHTAPISAAHRHTSRFTPQPFCSVFVHCCWLVCAKLCLFVLLFFVPFCSASLARSLGVWCFFSFGRHDVCFAACIGCFCAAYMYIYTHAHTPHVVSDFHTSYSLWIAPCRPKEEPHGWYVSDARNCLMISVKNITKTFFLSTSEHWIGFS